MKVYARGTLHYQPNPDKDGKSTGDRKVYQPGEELDIPPEEAKRLIESGVVTRSRPSAEELDPNASENAGVTIDPDTGEQHATSTAAVKTGNKAKAVKGKEAASTDIAAADTDKDKTGVKPVPGSAEDHSGTPPDAEKK